MKRMMNVLAALGLMASLGALAACNSGGRMEGEPRQGTTSQPETTPPSGEARPETPAGPSQSGPGFPGEEEKDATPDRPAGERPESPDHQGPGEKPGTREIPGEDTDRDSLPPGTDPHEEEPTPPTPTPSGGVREL